MRKTILGLFLLVLSGCQQSEQQKAYLEKTYQESLPRMAEVRENEANLQKKGIDKITVEFDFFDTFKISQAEYLCGLKQKFYFFFPLTLKNEYAMSGRQQKTVPIYCSREFLDRDPVFGFSQIYKDQYGRTVFWNSPERGYKTNHNPIQAEIWEKNKPKTQKEKNEAMSAIRKTCKDFGFKEGSEKYAECLKDLYLKENTQNNQPIIFQQGDSGSKALAEEMKARRHQDFYDELLGIGQESLKGRSLGEIYGGSPPRSGGASTLCNFTNSVMSGSNRICYYRCNTGTKTSNVGAAQQCPLTM